MKRGTTPGTRKKEASKAVRVAPLGGDRFAQVVAAFAADPALPEVAEDYATPGTAGR
jgi:hypothetical protein